MKVRAIRLFFSILLAAWLLALLLNIYTFDVKISQHSDLSVIPGSTFANVWWFVQISDIHISKYGNPGAINDFRIFCAKTIDVIKPELVLNTGDLTHAKYGGFSTQYKEEWEVYKAILKETGVQHKTQWIDIRGNHDAFDISSWPQQSNYYRDYSSDKKGSHQKVSRYIHRKSFGNYSFLIVDACPHPGPKRPFNFFGILDESGIAELQRSAQTVMSSNATFVVGHYPLSLVHMAHQSLVDSVLENCTAYLCGHLHTLYDSVPNMHMLHKSGYLELELGDWKYSRRFRVIAVDHDLMSFTDITWGNWPVVLITNPKDIRYITSKEPWQRMTHSTHIRILVFSPSVIESVAVSIDNGALKAIANHVSGPLYVASWKPAVFDNGLHTLTVTAKDTAGHETIVVQPFSLDGSRLSLKSISSSFLLLTDFCILGRILFATALSIVVVPLLVARFAPSWIQSVSKETLANRYILMASHSSLFYPHLIYAVYVALGPWFVGEIITNHWGMVFAYGVYVAGHFLPEGLTFIYAFLQLLFVNLPLLWYTVSVVARKHMDSTVGRVLRIMWIIEQEGVLAWCVVFQCWGTYSVYVAYGTPAIVISPVYSWSLLFIMYMAVKSRTVLGNC